MLPDEEPGYTEHVYHIDINYWIAKRLKKRVVKILSLKKLYEAL